MLIFVKPIPLLYLFILENKKKGRVIMITDTRGFQEHRIQCFLETTHSY
jgi:hypothetical protein